MRRDSSRWLEVSPSRFVHERAGLERIREGLPDEEPYRAWSNFNIVDRGRSFEVDLLVLGPGGLYLIELKNWERVAGDAYTWEIRHAGRPA